MLTLTVLQYSPINQYTQIEFRGKFSIWEEVMNEVIPLGVAWIRVLLKATIGIHWIYQL